MPGRERNETIAELSQDEIRQLSAKVEVYGFKGLNSRPFRRTFRNQAAFEKWMASDAAADVSIEGFRALDD